MDPRSDLADQVQKALVAHGAWKVRLAQAIETGGSEFRADVVARDNECVLGKWLYGELPPALKRAPDYATVLKLHADFHRAAADVLVLALRGKPADARAAMEPSSAFGRASTHLTLALVAWRSSFEG